MRKILSTSLREDLGLPHEVSICGLELQDLAQYSKNWILPERLRKTSYKRQREFVAGRLCASRALFEAGCNYTGELAQDIHGLPMWPRGWIGSISHNSSMALAAACPESTNLSFGLDIEEIDKLSKLAEIAPLIGRLQELTLLDGLSADAAVVLLFSAKESLYKALFPRLRIFREFSAAQLIAASAGRLHLRLEEDWGVGWSAGRVAEIRYTQRHNHIITACHLPWV